MNKPETVHKRILKVMYFTRDDPNTMGNILKGDAIEHEGKIWFVPLWLDSKEESWTMPLRLICLSEPPAGPHLQKMDGDQADYLLNFPIPISDFENVSEPQTEHGFEVLERPALKILRAH